MAAPRLTKALRAEYERLYATCVVRAERRAAVDAAAARLAAFRGRYEAAAARVGAPWHVVGAIHELESGCDFGRHLHNGDPLTARTVRVPAGRPPRGSPPFTWEESAEDALRLRGLHRRGAWDVAGTLYELEAWNGWGYRLYHPEVLSPYLWSFSTHYERGKYVADGTWSAQAVSEQCGAAVLLRRLEELGLAHRGLGPPGEGPWLRYSADAELPYARELQAFLNGFPDIRLRVDGIPGPLTSDAFRRVAGFFLHGDPRGEG